ncbi:MAG: hypothetical protein AAFX02_09385 [Pseudomonadota bacterium]
MKQLFFLLIVSLFGLVNAGSSHSQEKAYFETSTQDFDVLIHVTQHYDANGVRRLDLEQESNRHASLALEEFRKDIPSTAPFNGIRRAKFFVNLTVLARCVSITTWSATGQRFPKVEGINEKCKRNHLNEETEANLIRQLAQKASRKIARNLSVVGEPRSILDIADEVQINGLRH